MTEKFSLQKEKTMFKKIPVPEAPFTLNVSAATGGVSGLSQEITYTYLGDITENGEYPYETENIEGRYITEESLQYALRVDAVSRGDYKKIELVFSIDNRDGEDVLVLPQGLHFPLGFTPHPSQLLGVLQYANEMYALDVTALPVKRSGAIPSCKYSDPLSAIVDRLKGNYADTCREYQKRLKNFVETGEKTF